MLGNIETMVEFCRQNSPVTEAIAPVEIANTARFLLSPLASGISGATIYVDKDAIPWDRSCRR